MKTENTLKLEIVSAEEELFSDNVEMVFAPADMGEVGITPRHTPLITKLKPGDVRAQISPTETKTFYISGGLLEVQPDIVTILSDTAIREDDLDEERAKEAEDRAKKAMEDSSTDIDVAKAKAELAQAAAQLRLIKKLKNRK
ncbi:MAG: F0F1 ATP synthase subunit epsilon [Gammaproteobacteria bacterium]|nr:F0F1 ATP synthase subunit epsilon [Gammaproteobacteria bacterium]|tara:strand:- start:135000 stop:135425 length:426 start_codon:yes stop_codon:yes gene_type:complete